MPFRVGVPGEVKTAVRVGHFAEDVIEDFGGDAFVEFVLRDLIGAEIDASQLRVVVEHFFKVRPQMQNH